MISVWWLIPTAVVCTLAGMLLAGLLAAGRHADDCINCYLERWPGDLPGEGR